MLLGLVQKILWYNFRMVHFARIFRRKIVGDDRESSTPDTPAMQSCRGFLCLQLLSPVQAQQLQGEHLMLKDVLTYKRVFQAPKLCSSSLVN